jgi:hypothetical protein
MTRDDDDDQWERARLTDEILRLGAAHQRRLLQASPDSMAAWQPMSVEAAAQLWRNRLAGLSLPLLRAQLAELQDDDGISTVH